MSDAGAKHNKSRRVIDAVWRIESAKVIAAVARMVGDVDVAEDFAQVNRQGVVPVGLVV